MGRRKLNEKVCKCCGETKARDNYNRGGSGADCIPCLRTLKRVQKKFGLTLLEARDKVREIKAEEPTEAILSDDCLRDKDWDGRTHIDPWNPDPNVESMDKAMQEWIERRDAVLAKVPNGRIARGVIWSKKEKKFRVLVAGKWRGRFFTFEAAKKHRDEVETRLLTIEQKDSE